MCGPTAECIKALLDRSGCGWLPLSSCRTRSFLNFTVGVVRGNCWLAHRLRKAVRRSNIPQIASSSVTPNSRQILRRASFRLLAAVQTPQALRRRLSIQAARRACTHAVGGLKERKALHAKGYLRQRFFRRATWSTKAFPEIVLSGSVKDL